MAASASRKGYFYRKSLDGKDNPAVLRFRVGNSITVTHGDAVKLDASGVLQLAGAGGPFLGIVLGIVDELGINPLGQGYNNQTGATLSGDDTVTSASDNSSRTHYLACSVIVDPMALFYNNADDDVSVVNDLQLFDHNSTSDNIDVATASDTSGQMQLVQRDPDGDADLSKGLFRIVESQLLTQVGNSTAIIA